MPSHTCHSCCPWRLNKGLSELLLLLQILRSSQPPRRPPHPSTPSARTAHLSDARRLPLLSLLVCLTPLLLLACLCRSLLLLLLQPHRLARLPALLVVALACFVLVTLALQKRKGGRRQVQAGEMRAALERRLVATHHPARCRHHAPLQTLLASHHDSDPKPFHPSISTHAPG